MHALSGLLPQILRASLQQSIQLTVLHAKTPGVNFEAAAAGKQQAERKGTVLSGKMHFFPVAAQKCYKRFLTFITTVLLPESYPILPKERVSQSTCVHTWVNMTDHAAI